jgi:hypothetical protein
MKCIVALALLAFTMPLHAFENLDFEQTPPPEESWTDNVPGWQHISVIGGAGDYWNVNTINLSGWAEAFVLHLDAPMFPWSNWPVQPLDGRVSMAFNAVWPLLPTTNDVGSAWIRQIGTIEPGASRLTLLTDYTGPHIAYYPENPDDFEVGSLTLYFDETPVDYVLQDAGVGAEGQPLRHLWADLGAFAGQTGELRIGIEGPHTFIIDDIQLVPEPSPLASLAACLGALCLRGMVQSHRQLTFEDPQTGPAPASAR